MSYYFRHQEWKKSHPGQKPRKVHNWRAWLGRNIPAHYDISDKPIDWDFCDVCGCLIEDIHSFIYPQCEEDWQLVKALHLDIAYGYCLPCREKLDDAAHQLNPKYRYGTCAG
jgi:hypothetical protein